MLVHDLLLAKRGVAAAEGHVLRLAVERHRARLRAEFVKCRVRSGCGSVEEFRVKVEGEQQQQQGGGGGDERELIVGDDQVGARWRHPRWLRINTLRVSMDVLQRDELGDWKEVETLEEVMASQFSKLNPASMVYHADKDVQWLLAFPPNTDLSSISAYKRGELISQDKASCFPAYLLSSGGIFHGDILDACAAPGNKTSHIAAIVAQQAKWRTPTSNEPRIYATERDSQRGNVLTRMLKIAGAEHVQVRAGQDFFQLDPSKRPWSEVTAIILDPSCSGSGIVDRGQIMTFDLPSTTSTIGTDTQQSKSKNRKRKRANNAGETEQSEPLPAKGIIEENDVELTETNTKNLELRLKSLAALQIKMLTFAFSFPKVQIISYSTCSIHDAENENVVVAALAADVARDHGWKIMKRSEQVEGLKAWNVRGSIEACKAAMDLYGVSDTDAKEVAEACIRCEPFTAQGTQGFFVAGFMRDVDACISPQNGQVLHAKQQGDEWTGFDD